MNQIKLHLNSQMYAAITQDFISIVSTETDQVIIHIPNYTISRLYELQSNLIHKDR